MGSSALVHNNFASIATDPLRNFKFHVDIHHQPPGAPSMISSLGFTSVSGLSVTTESIPYRQGGYNTTVHQIPGQTTFSPITLQRGVIIGDYHNWFWMKELFTAVAGAGSNTGGKDFRAPYMDIKVLDHPVTKGTVYGSSQDIPQSNVDVPVKMRFRVYNAWITSLSYSDLNAGDNALFVEQMTLVHEGFDVKWADNKPGASAGDF